MNYHVDFVGADIFPQGFAAVADQLRDFRGVNMLADIGNGTMNVMYINDHRSQEKKCFTEKYGTYQCMLAVRKNLLKLYGSAADETIIDQVLRRGTASVSERYLSAIQEPAKDYVAGIFRRLREHEYDPELMKLYVVGGGGCLIKNFGEFDTVKQLSTRIFVRQQKGTNIWPISVPEKVAWYEQANRQHQYSLHSGERGGSNSLGISPAEG